MRVAPAVLLSPEERTVLLRWARGDPRHAPRALRARIVLLAAEGRQDVEIGKALRVGRLTAARWRSRFLAARLRGIDTIPRRAPRRTGIPSSRVREILRETALGSSVGSRRVSTRTLARKFGVSHTTVRRLWSEAGVSPAGYGARPLRPDPVPPREVRDVVGVYLRNPDLALAFRLGPTPLAAARTGTVSVAPDLPPSSEVPVVAPGAPRSAGWSALASPRSTAQRTLDFLRFLSGIEQATGRQESVRLVASLPGLASSRELQEWLARRRGYWVESLDDPETWRSRVLRDLERLGRLPAARGRRNDRGETARAIGLLLRAYAASSGPYEWTASRQEIASEDAGARLRYELSVTGHPGFKKPASPRASVRAPALPDAEVREMARVILRECLRVRPGEHVTIETWSETLEPANALVLETLRIRARPLVLYKDEPTYWAAVTENRPEDLDRVDDHLRAAIRHSDVLITFFGPSDRERFHALPFKVRYRLGEYYDHVYDAAAKAGTRAVQLALGRASPASARMYGVDLARWKAELIAGTTVDPQLLHRRGVRLAGALRAGKLLEVSHPNGTRLTLGLRHRKPEVADGLVPPARAKGDWSFVQLPAGVVSVALDERVAEGTFRSNVANTVGVCDAVGEVEDGNWRFARGALQRYSYARGHEVFSRSYERAPAGKERVGLLSLGLNDRISISPLLLDQEAGAVTLQIGRNDNLGGSNAVPWWAWLILRGADVAVDGRKVVRSGKLVE